MPQLSFDKLSVSNPNMFKFPVTFRYPLMFLQFAMGASWSVTFTLKVHAFDPQLFVAVTVTAVCPTEK